VALPLGVSFSCQRGRGLTARRAAVQPLRRENKSRTNTWTQLVERPDGQRVHLGADLWLVRQLLAYSSLNPGDGNRAQP
jgi:hypothetical protein